MNTFTLNDGTKIPQIGFGTYQVTGDDGSAAIKAAIEAGYRFFDTASLYETERVPAAEGYTAHPEGLQSRAYPCQSGCI